MASEIRSFEVTIPAGTAVATPLTVAIPFPPRIVEQIDILVPPGPRGVMGFAVGSSGVSVLPINQGAWIIADDTFIRWPLVNQIDSGGWEVTGYNIGQYDHTIYLHFHLSPTTTQRATVAQPISAADLSS